MSIIITEKKEYTKHNPKRLVFWQFFHLLCAKHLLIDRLRIIIKLMCVDQIYNSAIQMIGTRYSYRMSIIIIEKKRVY